MENQRMRPGENAREQLRPFLTVYAIIALLAAGAFGIGSTIGGGFHGATAQHPMMAGFDPMTLSAPMPMHYRFAHDHMPLMSQIPCYCGCQSFLAHRHLGDCFVQPNGQWESHASGCGVCTKEAATVETLLAEGRSPPDIRSAVIEEFGSP
jgi:hypothetical protein